MEDIITPITEIFERLGFYDYGFLNELTAQFLTAIISAMVVLLPFIVVYGIIIWIFRGLQR